MQAYKHLVTTALKAGLTVSVWDGEEWQVKRSTKPRAIHAAIESVDEAQLRLRDATGAIVGWALVIPGLDDGEDVADYTETPFMQTWEASCH